MYCNYQGSIKSVDICYFNNYIPREEEREYEIHIFLNLPVPNDYKWDKKKNSWTDCELGSDTWRSRNSKFFREAMKQKQQFWNDIEGWIKTEIKEYVTLFGNSLNVENPEKLRKYKSKC